MAEQTLWPTLGEAEARLLDGVRSRRNRRELYRRFLEDALLVQQLYIAPVNDPAAVEATVRLHVQEFYAANSPTVPLGIPTLQSITGPWGNPHDIILLDLRGQAPPRALVALSRAGEMISGARQTLGLVIIYGEQSQTDMLRQTVQRWIADYGRGAILKTAPGAAGMIIALDSRRLTRMSERNQPQLPLQEEITALRQLLEMADERPPAQLPVVLSNGKSQFSSREGGVPEGGQRKRTHRGSRGKRRKPNQDFAERPRRFQEY